MLSTGQEANQPQTAHDRAAPAPYLPPESAHRSAGVRRLRARKDGSPPAARVGERSAVLRLTLAGLWRARGVWLGLTAGIVALWGTLLLAEEPLRGQAEWLLVGAGVLGLIAWGGQKWASPFAPQASLRP